MSRFTLRVLLALFALSAAACASPTSPIPPRTRLVAPGAGASFDTTPVDTTCKSGYNLGQGKTC